MLRRLPPFVAIAAAALVALAGAAARILHENAAALYGGRAE